MITNKIAAEDLNYIYENFEEREKLKDSTILITGCAGFLGFYFLQFLVHYADSLEIKSIIGLDNFALGEPEWLADLKNKHKDKLEIYNFDIVDGDISVVKNIEAVDFVIHMASFASPTFYRMYPLETIEGNVWGLKRLFDFYKDKDVRGCLFFSSSEIYGDPSPEFIPTPEDYRGNVFTMGPRACYDESKRFGETLCYVYSAKFNFPVIIVRPFNNYGPGMRLDDKRVPADFALAVFENKDIVMFSDGSPKRTFCYISDAIVGYLKALTYEKFEYFNIGIDRPEISIKELAEIYFEAGRKIMGFEGDVKFSIPSEKEYLTHNPMRRCPNIDKAKNLLHYKPSIEVKEGVERFLEFIKIQNQNI